MSLSIEKPTGMSLKSAVVAICLFGPLPTLGVVFAAYGEVGLAGQIAWIAAKAGLFIGPLLWWYFIQHQPLRIPNLARQGMVPGLVSALLLASVIFLSYWWIAKPFLDESALKNMLKGVGITHVYQYLLLAIYLTFVNSLIEEYVFRWFFYKQFQRIFSDHFAIVASALLFTLHHSVVLAAYVPWYFNALASLGVLSGGLLWSWLYYRYGQIWPSYVSHIGADVGVFLIGYQMLF